MSVGSLLVGAVNLRNGAFPNSFSAGLSPASGWSVKNANPGVADATISSTGLLEIKSKGTGTTSVTLAHPNGESTLIRVQVPF
jgi:Flp pilus assembly secretin CpaC